MVLNGAVKLLLRELDRSITTNRYIGMPCASIREAGYPDRVF